MYGFHNDGLSKRIIEIDPARQHLWIVCGLIGFTSAVFAAWPELDIAFSRLFFNGQTFPLSRNVDLQRLRFLNELIATIVLGVSFLLICFRPLRDMWGIRILDIFVVFVAYGIGAGLIVNAGLKEYIGRARPRSVIEFGGTDIFTGVWQISDACQSNCSFTSGEAAGAMAMCSVLVLVPRGRAWIFVCTGMVLLSTALGLNRVAFGAHFLSDVLLSMLIIVAVILASKIFLSLFEAVDPRS